MRSNSRAGGGCSGRPPRFAWLRADSKSGPAGSAAGVVKAGRYTSGDVQTPAADVDTALPPGQGLEETEPSGVERQISRKALQQGAALAGTVKHGGDRVLILAGEQPVLNHAGHGVDAVAVHVVVAGDEEQAVTRERRGRVRIGADLAGDGARIPLREQRVSRFERSSAAPMRTTRLGRWPFLAAGATCQPTG